VAPRARHTNPPLTHAHSLHQVAVKVLDSDSILRREAATGLCLEALLGKQFRWVWLAVRGCAAGCVSGHCPIRGCKFGQLMLSWNPEKRELTTPVPHPRPPPPPPSTSCCRCCVCLPRHPNIITTLAWAIVTGKVCGACAGGGGGGGGLRGGAVRVCHGCEQWHALIHE
jgi:hypothetical protein